MTRDEFQYTVASPLLVLPVKIRPIGKILQTISAKGHSHINKTHSHISKRAVLISAKPYSTYLYIINQFMSFRIFASEYLNNTDNDFTHILFPTHVCLRVLGYLDRMHPIL